MKKILVTFLLGISFLLSTYAQETATVYQDALRIIENSPTFKKLGIETYTTSAKTTSFANQAYAFWLDDQTLEFKDRDFESYFGELYIPIEIPVFKELRTKKRAKHVFIVTETEHNVFAIEILVFKRKRRGKYPKFYQGKSYSFLFRKDSEGNVKLMHNLEIVSN
ncbi:hypothetical protein [uncultured Dokdonia sp.]|uniref:hypothetical protein n=1 Tax=uncultured Dokdonia sp. TaxID=575653 RepID=UPI002607A1FC|nr:hypothetical protein [uncultured Dokdonia sp.]